MDKFNQFRNLLGVVYAQIDFGAITAKVSPIQSLHLPKRFISKLLI
jgi:hypothetical protein